MSTFGGLQTAYSGLSTARQGLNTVGQNIVNAGTEGYTRQRIETSAAGPLEKTGMLNTKTPAAGQGVFVTGVSRLGNDYLDARVRTTASVAGYTAFRAETLTRIETGLNEPGEKGLSARLDAFWASWQDIANHPGDAAPTSAMLEEAKALISQTASGYRALEGEWSAARSDLDGLVTEVNTAAAQIADLNAKIRSTAANGGSVNELLDRRNVLAGTVAQLSGGTVREGQDGMIEVLVGGNALVSGDTYRTLHVTGARTLDGASANAPRLEWTHRPGTPAAVDGGEIGGALSVLAPANGTGNGGDIAEAAASYNAFATRLAESVNAVHRGGSTPDGTTGLDFFSLDATRPAALGLGVIPTSAAGVAAAAPGVGGKDGSWADAISEIGTGNDSPDTLWGGFVSRLGATARGDLQQGLLAESAATAAVNMQRSATSVDLDEENVNLLSYQQHYQAAARVLTAMDEMLDTLINATGRVGR